jgi:hypothetical protein
MKDYIREIIVNNKANSYKILKKNQELVDMLDKKYPHISIFKTKVQLYVKGMDDIPICKLETCSNYVSLFGTQFKTFCSNVCFVKYQKETGGYQKNYLKAKETCLDKYGVENYSQTDEFKERFKSTNLERYGVDNPNKCDMVREKTKRTNLERYGVDNPNKCDSVKEKRKNTMLERYGVENYASTDEFKEQVKKTNLEKYGFESYSQTDEFIQKIKQNNNEKYGVDFFVQTGEFKEKNKIALKEKYDVDHYSRTDEFKEKMKQTVNEKYGVDHYSQTDEFKEKMKQINLERYGVENYLQSDEFKEKAKQTSLEKYGVENYTQTDEFKEKAKQTSLEKYGVENPMQYNEFKEKAKQTSLEKYGVEYYSQTPEFLESMKRTNLEKYGVEHNRKKYFKSEFIDILDNKDQFEKYLNDYGTHRLAEMINCDVSTIYNHATKFGVNLPHRPNSYQEEIIHEFLEQHKINHIMNSRKILPSGLELDFYFPDYNFAIEINGLYWHSEKSGGKDRNYHYGKWKECNDLGITLLSISEDEFYNNQKFWLNKILYMVGKLNLKKLHARKCKIKELGKVSEFLKEHHLQGSVKSTYKFGLFYEDQLISVMTFGNPRGNEIGTIELSRFCNHSDYLVSGGASKLLNHFVKTYGHLYQMIISFSDNNYSNGNVYKSLGFSFGNDLSPDYKYVSKNFMNKYHKAGYRKSSILSKFDIPEEMKDSTEWELMQYLEFDRIWDSGKKKWILTI